LTKFFEKKMIILLFFLCMCDIFRKFARYLFDLYI
jgi:hypothetical protein